MKSKELKCPYCNCDNPLYLTKDHKTPKSRGGEDAESNLEWVCWLCNNLKGSLDPREFKAYLKSLNGLHSLAKVRIEFPSNIKLVHKDHHYPGFDYLKKMRDDKNIN